MLYWSAKFAVMNISIDKRKTDIIYVDKFNNHIAYNDEIIKLINNNNDSAIDIYVNILAGINKLNKAEIEILKYIMYNNNKISHNKIINDVSKYLNKSITTISRAINNLRNKKLIYINYFNKVIVSDKIYISKDNIDNSKFLIIELNPKITSKEITI